MKKIGICLICSVMGVSSIWAAPSTHRINGAKYQAVAKVIAVNKASAAQLALLKGLGVKKAQAVVAYRQQHGAFHSLGDLAKVRGVGVKLVARLKRNNPDKLRLN